MEKDIQTLQSWVKTTDTVGEPGSHKDSFNEDVQQ